jgi:hypothetical protein
MPFSADEVWNAVKRLPARKAPGPDGFTAEFVRACWATIKDDFTAIFQQLFELRGRGFSKLNQALLTLLPKRADACRLSDYRPISLIHLVAKIFAKSCHSGWHPGLAASSAITRTRSSLAAPCTTTSCW